eukprot:3539974-Pleurochrysis_carterae.AAC.1
MITTRPHRFADRPRRAATAAHTHTPTMSDDTPCPCMERLCDERACAYMYVRDEFFITINGDFEDDGFD